MSNSAESKASARFSLRTLLEVIAIVAVGLYIASDWRRSGTSAPGRFTIHSGPNTTGSNAQATFLVDTQTGETWIYGRAKWNKAATLP